MSALLRAAIAAPVAAIMALAMMSAAAIAQPYPNKPLKVVTPFPPGSGPDTVLRLVTDRMQRALGQPIVVENRVGANGLIAAEQVKRAAPDGYTLLQFDDAMIAANPYLYKKLPYDSTKDFEPVGTLFQTYFFVVVATNSPWKSMSDLLAAAKAKPGKVTHGTWGIGSVGHLGMLQFETVSALEFTHVPFQRVVDVYPAVGGGDVDWAFGSIASSGAMARAGKVRYLAAASSKRVAGFTDIPTIAESGGPANFDTRAWVALLAPRGVPADIVARLGSENAKAQADPEVREKLAAIGFEPLAVGPAETVRLIEQAQKRFGDIIQRAKISLD